MQLEQFAPYAVVFAAVITTAGVVIAAKLIKPATYTELFAENRALRGEVDKARSDIATLRSEFEDYKEQRRKATEKHDADRAVEHKQLLIVADGLDAALLWNAVLSDSMRTAGIPVPDPSEAVRNYIDAAKAIRQQL